MQDKGWEQQVRNDVSQKEGRKGGNTQEDFVDIMAMSTYLKTGEWVG